MLEHSVGFTLLFASLLCLGTWPTLLRLCSWDADGSSPVGVACLKPPDRVRHVCHVYLDYSFAYFVSSSIPLMVLSVSMDEEALPSTGAKLPLILVAMLGGALLSFGNMSLQWSTVVCGAPLTTVVALQASLTVMLGTSLNYLLEPGQTPRPSLLVAGVFVFLVAIAMAAKAQLLYTQQQECASRSYAVVEMQYGSNIEDVIERDSSVDYSERELPSTTKKPMIGVLVATMGGLCFGFFSPAFNIAVNDPFAWTSADHHTLMAVARANCWFSLAFAMASVVGNIWLLQRNGGSLSHIVVGYVSESSFVGRRHAIAAGIVCALRNILQFQGGQLVGYATADLVQAYPLVSTVWDVVLFNEFSTVSLFSRLSVLLPTMYSAYIAGIILLAASSVV